jgi:predicted nucleic acid-binding protein
MRRLFGAKCLLDTNVLAYALDRTASHFLAASQLLAHCVAGDIDGYVAQQNLLELLHVLTAYRHIALAQALSDVHAFARHPRLTVIGPAPQTLSTFFRLAHPVATSGGRIDLFDTYLVATMVDHGVMTLVTANVKDFRPIATTAGIDVIDVGTLTP